MDGRKRARAADTHDLEQCGSHEPVLPPTGRPTTLERAVGCDIVIGMQNADCKPPLLQAGAGKPELAALSLALYFGQKFGGDRASNFDFDPQAKDRARHVFEKPQTELEGSAGCGSSQAPHKVERPASIDAEASNFDWWRRGYRAAASRYEECIEAEGDPRQDS